MDESGNPVASKMALELGSVGGSNNIKVIVVFSVFQFGRLRNKGIYDPAIEESSDLPPSQVPCIEVGELSHENGGLYFVEAAIDSLSLVKISALLAIVAQLPYLICYIILVGGDRAGVAESAEVLARIEAEAPGIPERSEFFAFVGSAVGLGGILDDRNALLLGDMNYGIHISGLPVQVDRNYRPGMGSYRPVQFSRVHIEAHGVYIDGDHPCTGRRNSGRSWDAGVCGRDHFIAGRNSGGNEGKVQSFGSGPDSYNMAAAKIGRELSFEPDDFLAEYEPASVEHPANSLVHLTANRFILARQVTKGNFHP
jgi:hypothetical protein